MSNSLQKPVSFTNRSIQDFYIIKDKIVVFFAAGKMEIWNNQNQKEKEQPPGYLLLTVVLPSLIHIMNC